VLRHTWSTIVANVSSHFHNCPMCASEIFILDPVPFLCKATTQCFNFTNGLVVSFFLLWIVSVGCNTICQLKQVSWFLQNWSQKCSIQQQMHEFGIKMTQPVCVFAKSLLIQGFTISESLSLRSDGIWAPNLLRCYLFMLLDIWCKKAIVLIDY